MFFTAGTADKELVSNPFPARSRHDPTWQRRDQSSKNYFTTETQSSADSFLTFATNSPTTWGKSFDGTDG
jgi:hypothetical protein